MRSKGYLGVSIVADELDEGGDVDCGRIPHQVLETAAVVRLEYCKREVGGWGDDPRRSLIWMSIAMKTHSQIWEMGRSAIRTSQR